jgi:hypothetical protein
MAPVRTGHWKLARHLPSAALLASLALVCSCKPAEKPDAGQNTQMAMWLDSVPQLKSLGVSNAEIGELEKAHEAGLTDPSAVVLIQYARDRQQPFTDGQSIADLLHAGSSELTVVELAKLNQLGVWTGQAAAMRLAGLSDQIILAVAERRARNLSVLSGEKLGELKNTGVSDATILEMVRKGATEQAASKMIAERERAAGGHKFVYQTHANR